MKAYKPPVRSQKVTDGRVRRRLHAGLGWLRGFPLGHAETGPLWCVVPEIGGPEQIGTRAVDANDLRAAFAAMDTLVHEFPRALPRVVGDVTAWAQHLRTRLQLVRNILGPPHRQPTLAQLSSAFVAERARARDIHNLSSQFPNLATLVAAVLWVRGGERAELDTTVALLKRHAAQFEALVTHVPGIVGVQLALRICELATADDESRITTVLLGRLADPQFFTAVLSAQRETPSLGTSLAELVPRLACRDADTRRFLLRLLDLLLPDRILVEWQTWGRDCSLQEGEPTGCPPSYPVAEVLRAVEREAEERPVNGDRREALLEALAALPEVEHGWVVRASMFCLWRGLAERHPKATRLLNRCIRATRDYLRDKPQALPAMAPWREVSFSELGSHGETPYGSFLQGELGSNHVAPFFAALSLLERHDAATTNVLEPPYLRHWQLVAALLRCGLDASRAAEVVHTLVVHHRAEHAEALRKDLLAVVLALAGTHTERWLPLVNAVHRRYLTAHEVTALRSCCGIDELREVIALLLLDGHLQRVRGVIARLHLLEVFGGDRFERWLQELSTSPRQVSPMANTWWTEYPPGSRCALERLAEVDGDAVQFAARALADLHPDRSRLVREADALENRIANLEGERCDHIRRRLANLRARLAAPATVRPRTLRQFYERIERRHRAQLLALWERRLDDTMAHNLAATLGFQELPLWLSEPDVLVALAALMHQGRRLRPLVLRLLRARCGPPPWDLRDDPLNQAFIERARGAGLDVEPWLEGIGTLAVPARRGETIHLVLTGDPLDVFRMGA